MALEVTVSIDLEGVACDAEAARLLPWFVNGTLASADNERVSQHLQHCAVCRADLAHERALRTRLKDDGPIGYAPQAGLAQTLSRIDELNREVPVERVPQRVTREFRWRRLTATQWLSAAVVVQAIGIGVLGVSALGRSAQERSAARYETLSSATPLAAGPQLRAVFAPAMNVDSLRQLLGAQRLYIVAGPTDAGVFTLGALDPSADAGRVQALLAGLRRNPQVLFAEPAGTDGAVAR